MERTLAGLLSDFAQASSTLLRQEIALAKADLADRIGQAGAGAVKLVAGVLLLNAAFLVWLAAAVIALAAILPAWAAAAVVGSVVLLIGVVLLLWGRRDMRLERLVPRRALRTLSEDVQWARERRP
ncbi:MAG TPA: phage holin family protein [Stellaceae bacterium]|nr:phage holin family protein [Stellaceae bacterium]